MPWALMWATRVITTSGRLIVLAHREPFTRLNQFPDCFGEKKWRYGAFGRKEKPQTI